MGFLSDRSKSGCLRWSLKLIMRLTRQIKKHPLAGCLFIRSSKRLRLHTTKVIITESSPERKFFFSCTIPTLFRSVPDLPLPAPLPGRKRGGKPAGFPEKKRPPQPALPRRGFLFPVLKRSVLAATFLPRNCQAACLAAAQDKSDERACKG